MTEIVALKKRRAYIKGNITKILNYVTAINTAHTDVNAEDIKVRLANVERFRNEFIGIEDKIITLDINENLDEDFEENYYRAVAGLNLALRTRMEPTLALNETIIDTSIVGTHADVKLPKITIPYFSGDYTEWQSFHDLFCSTIHDNPKLTPSQKLQYLKGSIKGEAFNLLKHYSITDANYIEALIKLRERYDRKKHSISAFIKNFMYQPSIVIANSTNVRRLLDTSDEVIRGLKALGEDAESRDHWLIHILVNKLDEETNSLWAQASAEYNFPTLKQFFSFLSRRVDALESIKGQNKRTQNQPNQFKPMIKSHVVSAPLEKPCSLCITEYHKLYECTKFKGMPTEQRKALLSSENRCFNCLNDNHNVYTCKSRFRCRQCKRKHHTLLHDDSMMKLIPIPTTSNAQEGEAKSVHTTNIQIGCSLLPTALVRVVDGLEQYQLCRVLLDSGSQGSFITESCVQRLGLKRSCAKLVVSGMGGITSGYTKGAVSLIVTPWYKTTPSLQIEAYVFPRLTAKPHAFQNFNIEFFKQYELADPHFYKGLEIDIIIGAEWFFNVISEGKIMASKQLVMQNTLFGWVVAGKSYEEETKQSLTVSITNPDNHLDNLMKKFWEIETVQIAYNKFTQEEQFCENNFKNTTTRDSTGRFKVSLPFKVVPSILGNSYQAAVQRVYAMERKFKRDIEFAVMYRNFMSEYISLGHMKPIDEDGEQSSGYYLPHHGVLKTLSTTTKLRVVFDGSAKTSSGKSLNDCLAVGPIVQSSLFDILFRFRKYKVAFTGDIEKMFRQVLVAENDTKFQRILWRETQDKPLKTYELQTVTYGTASAPYLATRALNESTTNYQETFPDAVDHIRTSIYVDDLMTGADTIENAIKLRTEINSILSNSEFQKRKWLSNEKEVIGQTDTTSNILNIMEIDESNSTKVLGLFWNPKRDCFHFKVNLEDTPITTKRGIISEASRQINH